jgi:hypothetical protein
MLLVFAAMWCCKPLSTCRTHQTRHVCCMQLLCTFVHQLAVTCMQPPHGPCCVAVQHVIHTLHAHKSWYYQSVNGSSRADCIQEAVYTMWQEGCQ